MISYRLRKAWEDLEQKEAEIARLTARLAEVNGSLERAVADLRYVQGIVERGEWRTVQSDEPITEAILNYVKKLEAGCDALRAALRMCVKAVVYASTHLDMVDPNAKVIDELEAVLALPVVKVVIGEDNDSVS